MPPTPPVGWSIPMPLQWTVIIMMVLTPFISTIKDIIRDKNSSRDTRQQSFIDSLIKANEKYPEALRMHSEVVEKNSQLEARIIVLERKVDELDKENVELRGDRDSWRDQARRVPILEGELIAWRQIAADRSTELERLREVNKQSSYRDDQHEQLDVNVNLSPQK